MGLNENIRYLNIGLPDDIRQHKEAGNYTEAIRLIDRRMEETWLPECMKKCMIAEKELMQRTAVNFPYTRETALAKIREKVADFTEEEFNKYMDDRRIRWIYIDGQQRIVDSFYGTLNKTEPAFAKRTAYTTNNLETVRDASEEEHPLDRCMRIMKEKGKMTVRLHMRAYIKLEDQAFKPGMKVKLHLPIPADCEQQSEIQILDSTPGGKIDPADAWQRTISWDEEMQENHPFFVEYSYVHCAKYHETEGKPGDAVQPTFSTEEEAPHIVFTPYIKALVGELTEGLTDPMEKARAIYNFITHNMKYTFMQDYFTLENIPDSCAKNYNGDCGVLALTFVTMCRCAGIPAEWQSGMDAEPWDCGGHDWTRFYIAPYGWFFADPSYGTSAFRSGNLERNKFYFGNLDPYRFVANRGFMKPFLNEKKYWRQDPYDNQSGEMECEERGFRGEELDGNCEVISCEEI